VTEVQTNLIINLYTFQRVDTQDGDTVVILYFDSLGMIEICPTLHALRTYKVANTKAAPVVVYDYYDNCKGI
jgi:hypothetical protein